jgi:hypothetical protein
MALGQPGLAFAPGQASTERGRRRAQRWRTRRLTLVSAVRRRPARGGNSRTVGRPQHHLWTSRSFGSCNPALSPLRMVAQVCAGRVMDKPVAQAATSSASSTSPCSRAPAPIQRPSVRAAWWSASVRLPGRAASRLAITVSTDPDGTARVAALATPVAPGVATLLPPLRLALGANRWPVSQIVEPARPEGQGDEALRVARLTHTEVAAPPATPIQYGRAWW